MKFHPRILGAAQRSVLQSLASWTREHGFYLAGGTAVALYYGHRESVDFDWFRLQPISAPAALVADVERLTGTQLQEAQIAKNTVLGALGGVKISFFTYPYALLAAPTDWCGIALASLDDLCAMKLAAVAGRNTKKDFVDLHLLMTKYASLSQMLALFATKYPTGSIPHLLRALTYFSEADHDAPPRMLARHTPTWNKIKSDIVSAVNELP